MTMNNPTSSGNLFDLTGKVAVISGAAQGLGKAASLAVAQAGANVVLVDRNILGLEATADLIRKWGEKLSLV